jgi:hypothetical protein
MKRFIGLLCILLLLSCSDKKDCDCTAYGEGFAPTAAKGDVMYCHNGNDIVLDKESSVHGQFHDGVDCFKGSCDTAGLDDLEGVPYSNDCADDGKRTTIDGVSVTILCVDTD